MLVVGIHLEVELIFVNVFAIPAGDPIPYGLSMQKGACVEVFICLGTGLALS